MYSMKTAQLLTELHTRHGVERTVVAFGVFDGVHRGHAQILKRVVDLAEQHHAIPTVVTFDPHPRTFLRHTEAPPLLTSLPRKLRLLATLGIEATVLLPFDDTMARMPPEAFLDAYVFTESPPRPLAICVGAAWRFGRGGAGTTAILQSVADHHQCTVESIPEVLHDGRPISSTRIREAVREGRLDDARLLLGHDVAIDGRVRHGRGLGGTRFSCPTANLESADVLLPPGGVYAAMGHLLDSGLRLPGIAYIGTCPTLDHDKHRASPPHVVEVHLFDFNEDLYGREIEVAFVQFLRPERKFPDTEQLRRQIAMDIEKARTWLNRHRLPHA